MPNITPERRALYLEASHKQGGHSKRGGEIADELGIPFPLNMTNLEKAAKRDGFDPNELWPWLAPMRAGKTS
jgi:hypothetical protein